ncbi:MAG: hypothetical protein R6W75_08780, partial [Smithellaceae bacterium]
MRRKIFFSCCLFALCLIPYFAASQSGTADRPRPLAADAKRILFLYSLNYHYPSQKLFAAGVESAWQSAGEPSGAVFHEFLDIPPTAGAKHRRALRDLLQTKYAGIRFDAIVTLNDPALDFLLEEGRNLFLQSPCLAVFTEGRTVRKTSGREIVQVPFHADAAGTLDMALKLLPETRRVVFISGTGNIDLAYERKARADFAFRQEKIQFEYTGNMPLT